LYIEKMLCYLLRLDAPEEDLADGSAHAELSEHSERILENI